MSAMGAKGRQRWAPSGVSHTSVFVTARGVRVMRPRTGVTMGGAPHSLTSMMSWRPVQVTLEGPISRRSGDCVSACRPRSVMVKRPFRPEVTTFRQQWFCGSRRPDHLYQGEKTEPMKPITESARTPSSATASRYHQA